MAKADARGLLDWASPGRSDYTPIAVLARGGMGKIELAVRREGNFERLYAVKRPHSAYRGDSAFQKMFLDEARIAGLIRHPNVVPTIDLGVDPRGPFLVMEYVEGISAAKLIQAFAARGELLPIQVALSIMIDVARGLDAAHRTTDLNGVPLGIVHRDVSPSNVLVGFDGVVRMTDFGVAKAFDRSTRTHSGVLKGRFGYMSPEQLQYKDIDGRADVFSMGVVLYELLSSQRLYVDDEVPAPRKILEDPPPDLTEARADAPPALVDLLFRMLAKDRESRPQSAGACAATLEGIRAELVASEGLLPMQAFLQENFQEEIQKIQSRIQTTLAASQGGAGPSGRSSFSEDPPLDWTEEGEAGSSRNSMAPPRDERRRPLGPAATGVAAVLGVAALAAAVYFLALRPSQPEGKAAEAPGRATVASPPASAATTGAETPPPPVAPSAEGAAPPSPAPEAEAEADKSTAKASARPTKTPREARPRIPAEGPPTAPAGSEPKKIITDWK